MPPKKQTEKGGKTVGAGATKSGAFGVDAKGESNSVTIKEILVKYV